MLLYSFFRSSAAYRVRIALNYKGIPHETVSIDLNKDGGEQHRPQYRAVNPQGRVPAIKLDDGSVITQSMAILEYLEEAYPEPHLLPDDLVERARVRAIAMTIVADIHPLNNSSTLTRLRERIGANEGAVQDWYSHWVSDAFRAIEACVDCMPFAIGARPTLADVCLVPQVANARRFNVDLAPFPKIVAIDARCAEIPAFVAARPENQPDAA